MTRPITFHSDGESLLLDTDEGIRPVGVGLRHLGPRVPGDVDGYIRLTSDQEMTPPYTVTGRVKTISNAGRDGVFPDGVRVWYNPTFCIHPVYGSGATFGRPVDNNTLVTLGHMDRPDGKVGCSAEMRTERPERPYGARSGYASRTFGRFPVPFWDSKWHDLKVTVHESHHYTVWWDGKLMADVVENTPATVIPSTHWFGLRLDFCDVCLGEFHVTEHPREEVPVTPTPIVPRVPARVLDTRNAEGRMPKGSKRRVHLGPESAFIRVTCVGSSEPGYLSYSTDGADFSTSLVNWESGQVGAGGAPVLAPGGWGWIYVSADTHVIVDLYAD